MDALLLQKFTDQINQANGIGVELLNKKEFNFLVPYFFNDETVNSVIVGEIIGQLYLVALTNQRLFFVEKNPLNLFVLKRFGIEEVLNLELDPYGFNGGLKITFLDQNQIKLDSLGVEKAQKFGQIFVQAHRVWGEKVQEI